MDNRQDFTQGSIFKKVTAFMFPILGALILQAMYGAVDMLIVGRYGTADGISGVSTGSNIMNLFTFILCALCTGVTVLTGNHLGAKQKEKISPLVGSAIAFFAVTAIVLSALLILLARPIAVLMQAPKEAIDATVTYIRICGAGFLFITFYNFISSVFRGIGNSRLPMLFVAIACIVNILGDLLLVKVLRMNVAGAAIATVAAQAVSVVLSLIIIRRIELPFTIRISDIRLSREALGFLKIGAPLALQEFLTNLTFLAICAFVNRIGLDASSGYGIAQRIQSFVLLIPSSLMQCMAPFVAQNVGAGKEDRAWKGMLCGMTIGASIGVIIMLLALFKGNMLASIFVSDSIENEGAVISRAAEYLKGFASEAVVTSIMFSFLGFFNGHSRSTFVMLQGMAQSFLVRLPVSYFMSLRCVHDPDYPITGIGIAAPSATVVGIFMCTVYFFHMRKTQSRIAE